MADKEKSVSGRIPPTGKLQPPQQQSPSLPPAPDPPTAAAPITPDHKSETQRAYREARTAITLLQQRWPAAFPETPQQVRPLITGLVPIIAAALGWSHPYTRTVLRMWKLRPAYCHAVLAHPVRFDLDGNPTDQPINEDARTQAKARLAAWAKKRNQPAPRSGERAVAPAVDHDTQQQGGTSAAGAAAACQAAAAARQARLPHPSRNQQSKTARLRTPRQAAPPAAASPGLAPRRQGALARIQRHVSARDGRRSGRGADRHAHPPAAQERAAVRRAAMRGDAVTLGDLVGRITVLEVACRRCERRGRLSVARLIEQHGDMRLPELCDALPGDCPKRSAVSVGERCSVY